MQEDTVDVFVADGTGFLDSSALTEHIYQVSPAHEPALESGYARAVFDSVPEDQRIGKDKPRINSRSEAERDVFDVEYRQVFECIVDS